MWLISNQSLRFCISALHSTCLFTFMVRQWNCLHLPTLRPEGRTSSVRCLLSFKIRSIKIEIETTLRLNDITVTEQLSKLYSCRTDTPSTELYIRFFSISISFHICCSFQMEEVYCQKFHLQFLKINRSMEKVHAKPFVILHYIISLNSIVLFVAAIDYF